MHHPAWYANFRHRLRLAINRPIKAERQQKKQAHHLLIALPMLWLCIAILMLIFVCWLLLWMRLPLFNKQNQPFLPISAKQEIQPRRTQLYAYPNRRDWVDMRQGDWLQTLKQKPKQRSRQTLNKVWMQRQPDLGSAASLPEKWGLSIQRLRNTQYRHPVLDLKEMQKTENEQDCVEIEICSSDNKSDVALLEAEE